MLNKSGKHNSEMQNRNEKHENGMLWNAKTQRLCKFKVLNYHLWHMLSVLKYKSHSDLIIPPQTETIIDFIKPEKTTSWKFNHLILWRGNK